MSRHTVLLVVAAIAIGGAPAWAQQVKTDHDPSASFATVKTYYWARTDPSQNDLMNQRLMSAVDSWLTAKGWTKAPDAQADVAVVPIVTEGTLVIDLYRARTKKLMWRGTATDTISDDPKKAADKIHKAVEKMFKNNFRPRVTETE